MTDYVSSRADVEPTLRSFQEMISKYQFMEVNTQRRAQGLREKIPDIRKTLDMVRFLKKRREAGATEPIQTHFELNDTLYARATVDPADTDEVYLWLGANVMLAYPIDEAEKMLEEKLRAAETSLGNCEEDMEFLREQITVRSSSNGLCGCSSGLTCSRHSKSLPPACTTGTSCRGAKRGPRARRRKRRAAPTAELNGIENELFDFPHCIILYYYYDFPEE